MLPDHFRGRLGTERCHPDPRLVPFRVDLIRHIFHSVRELLRGAGPVADSGLISVIHLIDGDLVLCRVQSVQIPEDGLFRDLGTQVVPGGVSGHTVDLRL